LRKSFALYLAPAIIEEMTALNKLPVLGGETRDVTVFFSDIAGFSSISESLTPTHLVALMNEYFSTMTDTIQDHGGFVDKYIGDAIVAVFGAPLDDQGHATSAVLAALRCCERLSELNQTLATLRGRTLEHRIGLDSGGVLVGNIGSPKRFNYTVMGDAVNLASRLQNVNKFFGSSIIASEKTFWHAHAACAWRELDVVRIQGRAEPVKIYEPLARRGKETSIWIATYADALARWRAQDFAGCVERLMPIADADPPSAMLLRRAKMFTNKPPSAGWDGVTILDGK
jgi:adenylate cyclase